MKYIFLLSGDYADLGREEVLTLFDAGNFKLIDRLLIADVKNNENIIKKLSQRLALTKSIYKLLFECKINELIKTMEYYDWNSVSKGSFCLRIYNLNDNKNSITNKFNKKIGKNNKIKRHSEKDLAKYIWHSVQNPKVDLENPKTKIELFVHKEKVYCGLLAYENNEGFESRRSHLRPFPHPSSLHPKLARALVNITGIKKNETLLDPFCGTGGFLIEAGLMGIKTIGYDISKNMAEGCKENLDYFNIKNYAIKNKNALDIENKNDYAVTDLPYGLNSNVYLEYYKNSLKRKSNKINLKTNKRNQIKNIEGFYSKFLQKLRKILKKKAVIIFPSYANYKKLLQKSKFKIDKEFEIYVHRSLTRKIVKIS
ncbi:methyltransferase domain-containing protein [Candidatus Woesearchaeota archaeon]|nr:methyltransferase domain-containing protein [Candidatus Woesearchaeota archaeon]